MHMVLYSLSFTTYKTVMFKLVISCVKGAVRSRVREYSLSIFSYMGFCTEMGGWLLTIDSFPRNEIPSATVHILFLDMGFACMP